MTHQERVSAVAALGFTERQADFLVHVIFLPDLSWHRELCKSLLDSHFGLYITDIIFFEHSPFVRSMEGTISYTLSIGFCGRTRLAEVFDEVFSFCELLLFKSKNRSDSFKG